MREGGTPGCAGLGEPRVMEPTQTPLCLCQPCAKTYERPGFTKKLPKEQLWHRRPSRSLQR